MRITRSPRRKGHLSAIHQDRDRVRPGLRVRGGQCHKAHFTSTMRLIRVLLMHLRVAVLFLGAYSWWTWVPYLVLAAYVGDHRPALAQVRADESNVVLEHDQDAYDIYSMLLRTELPPSWRMKRWMIEQATRRGPLAMCIQPPTDQEPIYRPIIQDFERKNQRRFLLERNLDLPEYDLVAPSDRLQSRDVLFEVSAVGFNGDHTRALVYVGHHCGSTCGGGTYHLLAKKAGRWDVDHDFRGAPPCLWAS
jgi:hypothetical protein